MLYLISDYFNDYPHRKKNNLELLRFEKTSKFLHEMTIDEINAETSKWSPVSAETAEITKRKIALYLEWLLEKCNNITIPFEVRDIVIPLKQVITEAIYSTDDIRQYYKLLETSINRMATRNGTSFSPDYLLTAKAAGILAFYGLSDYEILALDLSDVTEKGVVGYDLPLTKCDIDILLSYKRLEKYTNHKTLKGTKYIRTVIPNVSPNAAFLNAAFKYIEVEDEYKYLTTLLKTSQLNLFGKFDRAYKEEKCRDDKILVGKKTPQWFADIFHLQGNWLLKRKHEYITYRDLRNKRFSKDLIVERIEEIDNSISKLNREKEELQKLLH